MTTKTVGWPASAHAAAHGVRQHWWTHPPRALLSPVGLTALLALCALLALLMAFHQVVSGAVQQGEAQRQTRALQAEAAWRCRLAAGHITRRPGLTTESDCNNPGVHR